jgi:hypothetical protein
MQLGHANGTESRRMISRDAQQDTSGNDKLFDTGDMARFDQEGNFFLELGTEKYVSQMKMTDEGLDIKSKCEWYSRKAKFHNETPISSSSAQPA